MFVKTSQSWRWICATVYIVGLLISGSAAYAAEQDVTIELRPGCTKGYAKQTSETIDEACPPFNTRDPQTQQTRFIREDGKQKIDIVLHNPSKQKIRAVRAWLSYDSSILSGTSIKTQQGFFPIITPGEADFSPEEGQVKIGISNEDGNGVDHEYVKVATIEFSVLQHIEPGTPLSFYDIQPGGHTSVQVMEDDELVEVLGTEPGALLVRTKEKPTEEEQEEIPDPSENSNTSEGNEEATEEPESGSGTTEPVAEEAEPTEETATEPPVPECEFDSECPVGTICIEQACTAVSTKAPIGSACTVDEECDSKLCDNNVCTENTEREADRTAFGLLQPRNVRVTTENGSVFLAWDDLRSSLLKAYNVYYGTTSGQYIQRKTIPGSSANVTIRSLPEGAKYFFAVRAVNVHDVESAFSQEVSVVVGNPTTSTAPLIATVYTDAPAQNPVTSRETAPVSQQMPGETGSPLIVVLLLLFSAIVGTILASRRQLTATTHKPHND